MYVLAFRKTDRPKKKKENKKGKKKNHLQIEDCDVSLRSLLYKICLLTWVKSGLHWGGGGGGGGERATNLCVK